MQALITIMMIPLVLLNLLGGVGSGVWLVILGDWWVIGYGIALLVGSPFLLGLAMMPSLILMVPAAPLLERGRIILAAPFLFLGGLYTIALISGWCLFILWFFVSRADYNNYIPILIWSYGVALGPWMYMAQKEAQSGGSGGEHISIFFAQVAYIAVVLTLMFTRSTLFDLGALFLGIMGIGLVIQFVLAFVQMREQSRSGIV